MAWRGVSLVVLLVSCALSALGRVISVPEECAAIQSAVDLAGSGDVVDVAPGIYDENVVVACPLRLYHL